MFTMTFKKALEIQARQLVWYRQYIGRKGIKIIRKQTVYPSWIEPDKEMSVIEINRLIPRGGSIETLQCLHPSSPDPLTYHYCKAMEKGLILP